MITPRAFMFNRVVEQLDAVFQAMTDPAPPAAATEHLRFYERFWNARLDALEAYAAPSGGRTDEPTEDA